MVYNFDVETAKEYGVDAAVFISNLQYWLLKNKANNKNYYDNHYWTYNSLTALTELFPFWSIQNIKTILNNLKEKGVIIVGNYNKNKYDKTNWYAFADEEKWLKITKQNKNYEESVNKLEPAQQQVKTAFIDKLELTHQEVGTTPPIPDKNTNNKPNSISNFRTQEEFIPPTLEEVLEYAKEQNNCAGTVGFRCSKKTAELFWSNYEANGWIISNECRTPIRDWKAKLRNWAIKESFISAKNDDIIVPKRATGDK